jgi:hypothetical protein
MMSFIENRLCQGQLSFRQPGHKPNIITAMIMAIMPVCRFFGFLLFLNIPDGSFE